MEYGYGVIDVFLVVVEVGWLYVFWEGKNNVVIFGFGLEVKFDVVVWILSVRVLVICYS